jgi:hypothetical protein
MTEEQQKRYPTVLKHDLIEYTKNQLILCYQDLTGSYGITDDVVPVSDLSTRASPVKTVERM